MKRILSCLLFTTLLVSSFFMSIRVFAYTSDKHDRYLREVLFGDSAVRNTDVLDALNDASALAIDQHGSDGQNILDELRTVHKIKGLPKSIEKFKVGHGSYHRKYTHKGWNYDYTKLDGDDEAHWSDIRKKIILKTVNQSFDFGILSGMPIIGYSDQCESMAALIYYVHIIGDHISNETYKPEYKEIPLIKGNGQYGIIEELEKYSANLFTDHTSSLYMSYMADLDELKESISEDYYYPEDLDDPAVYKKYHSYAEELMECLKEHIPLLIKKEKFFKKVFYPDN